MSFRLMPILYVTLVLTVCSLSLSAQEDYIPDIKYGEIPVEQMVMEEYALDTEACAVVLADVGELKIDMDASDLYYVYTRTTRIKIMDDGCEDHADVKVQYLSYRGTETLLNLDAHTILGNGKEVKVEKDQIFTEEVNDYVTSKNFSFPNVQPGVVLEYTYTIRSQQLSRIRPWLFQDDLPKIVSALKTDFPNWVQLEYLWTLSEKMVKSTLPDGTQVWKGDQARLIQTPDNWYIMENVPAQDVEPFITTMSNYLSTIEFQVKELNINGQFIEIITSWPQAIQNLYEHQYFGKQFSNKSNHKKVLNALAPLYENNEDPASKARLIYNLVQKSVEWNGQYSIFTTAELDDAFEKGTGNSADVNLMLLALLQDAGFKAQPILISTRSNGKMYKNIPLMSQFNHVLVFLELEGQGYFLDPLHKYVPFGAPHVEALNGEGMISYSGNVGWVNIPVVKGKDSYFVQYEFDEDLGLKGMVKGSYTNYNAFGERASHYSDGGALDKWESRLKEVLDEASVDTVKSKNLTETNEVFEETLAFTGEGGFQDVGDYLYITPLMISNFHENVMKSENRRLPVEFAYPFEEQVIAQMKVPEGYVVEQLPENAKLEMLDGGASFTFLASEQLGTVMCRMDLKINNTKYIPERYQYLRNIFASLEEKLQEQIVLRKTENDEE